MADGLENLNFQVILDHKDFDREVKKVKDIAKGLNIEVSKALDLKQKVASSNAKIAVDEEKIKQATAKTAQEQEKVNTQKAKTRLEEQKIANLTVRTQNAQRGVTGAVTQTNTTLLTTSSLLRTISQLTGVAFSVVGIRRFLSSLIEVTGQFEVQKMALRNMLQDIDAADKIYQDLYRFSSDSTYRFSELAKYAKQLAAFNIDKSNLLETTKMLGDVASGVGVSMDRIILAYGHVKSSGFLRGIQLRSFAQNGVPVLEELSKILTDVTNKTVSLGDVFDLMMKRQIPFEMVEQAFKNMTSEGGKFYQMQEVLAKTLAGQINILKGRWENMLAAIGEKNSGFLKNTVSGLSNLISNMENIGKLIAKLVIGFGAYQVTLFTATAATEGLAVATNVGLVGALKRAATWMYKMIAANPYAALAVAVGILTTSLYSLATQMSEVAKIEKVANKATSDYEASLASEIAELDHLITRLKLAKEGTEEYFAAKNALETRFGPYLQELRNEGVEVNNLANTYDNLRLKIAGAMRARFLEAGSQDLKRQLDDSTKTINEDVEKTLGAIGKKLTEEQKEILSSYVFGLIDENDPAMKNLKNLIKLGNGEGGPRFQNYMSLETLRTQYGRVVDAYDAGMKKIEVRFAKLASIQGGGGAEKELTGWRKLVADKIKGLDETTLKETGLTPKEDEDYYDYLKRVGEKFKELKEEKDKALAVDKPMYNGWIKAIKGVDKALEGNILKDARYNREPWNGGKKDPDKEKRNDLKARISLLERYMSIYEKIEPIMGENTASWMAEKLGGSAEDYQNLDEQIKPLIDDLKELGEEGKEAADAIEARLGMDEAGKLVKQAKEEAKAVKDADQALKKYIETLEKMGRKSGDTENQGVAHKVANAIEKYKDKIADAEKLYGVGVDALKKSGAEDQMSKELELRFAMWGLMGTAANDLRNDLEGLADEVFKLAMNGYDLTDWGDKSLAQILDIEDALKNIDLPEEVKALLTPEQQARMTELVKELASAFLKNTVDPEKLKKIGSEVKVIAGEVEGLIGSAEELAEVANPAMAEGIRAMKEMADVGGRIVEKLLKEDWISAIAIGIGWIGQKIIENVTATKRWEQELKAARAELEHFRLLDYLEGTDSILGDDSLNKFQRAMSARALLVANFNRQLAKYNMTWKDLQAHSEFFNADGTMNTDAMAAAMKIDGVEAAATWDYIISHAEEYNEALQIIRETQEEVIGGIAASAADQIVEGWIAAGDAALDYADILDDVARKYAKMVVEQMIMDALPENLVEDLAALMAKGDTEGYMALLASVMETIKDMSPEIQAVLQSFDPYFNRNDEESGSLGKGIKSITEETASLLASYLNAIRADVSYMRSMAENGWLNVESIAGVVTPKLADYAQQIAANTANNAQSTAEILSRLNDVIGSPDTDGMVVRVQQM